MVYFAIVGGAAALETTQIEEIEEVAWEELMPECLWKFRVKDFGPLTVGIDAHGNSLYHDVQARAQEKLKELYARLRSSCDSGLTHVLDKGLGPRAWEDVLETSGDYIDDRQARLGHGLRDAQPEAQARGAEGEAGRDRRHLPRGRVSRRTGSTSTSGGSRSSASTHVEISDGVIDIQRERKLELIADFARDFTVLSEVGSKDSEVDLRAVRVGRVDPRGARSRRLEGDHRVDARAAPPASSARPARCAPGSSTRSSHSIDVRSSLICEAPTKSSQAWFIRKFGASVNLGNIPPDEVIPLETLRLGLRGDTLKEVLLGDAQPDLA